MAWQYLKQDSLWALYMKSKYHGFAREGPGNWKSIKSFIPTLRQHAIWILGDGATSVNNFLSVFNVNTPACLNGLNVAQVIHDNKLVFLNECLPLHARIDHSFKLSDDKDFLAWSFTVKGKFCVKTFLRIENYQQPSQLGRIWHDWVPPKILIFAWKVCHRAIPTDDRLCEIGFRLASRCLCCSLPCCENIPHLFLHSDAAKVVWGHFNPIFSYPMGLSLSQMFRIWVTDVNPRSQFGCLSIAIFLFGLWEIWKHRNKRRHEEVPPDLIQVIIHQVSKHTALFMPRQAASFKEQITIKSLRLVIKVPPRMPSHWVAWKPGNGITVNLEVSGDARKGSAIFRDQLGAFVCALVCVLNFSCREANLLSVLRRVLDLGIELKIPIDEVQCPDKLVCGWFHDPSHWPWLWTYDLRRCRALMQETRVLFIPKELNICASSLLKAQPGRYHDFNCLPLRTRGLLRLDELQTPVMVPD